MDSHLQCTSTDEPEFLGLTEQGHRLQDFAFGKAFEDSVALRFGPPDEAPLPTLESLCAERSLTPASFTMEPASLAAHPGLMAFSWGAQTSSAFDPFFAAPSTPFSSGWTFAKPEQTSPVSYNSLASTEIHASYFGEGSVHGPHLAVSSATDELRRHSAESSELSYASPQQVAYNSVFLDLAIPGFLPVGEGRDMNHGPLLLAPLHRRRSPSPAPSQDEEVPSLEEEDPSYDVSSDEDAASDASDEWSMGSVAQAASRSVKSKARGRRANVVRPAVEADAPQLPAIGRNGRPLRKVAFCMSPEMQEELLQEAPRADSRGQKRARSRDSDAGGYSHSRNRRCKHHNPWTMEETEALVAGVERCGGGKWAEIKKLCFAAIERRSPVDLKDKWRNLLRVALPSLASKTKCDKKREISGALLDRIRSLAGTTGVKARGDRRLCLPPRSSHRSRA